MKKTITTLISIIAVVMLWVGYGNQLIDFGQKIYKIIFDRDSEEIISKKFEGEILILISDFHDQSEKSFNVSGRIFNSINHKIKSYNLKNIRVERINKSFKLGEINKAKKECNKYKANIIIWGHYDDIGLFPYFSLIEDKYQQFLPEDRIFHLISSYSPPEKFCFKINKELPDQMNCFTLFMISMILFDRGSYNEVSPIFDDLIQHSNIFQEKEIKESLVAIYHCRGFINLTEQKKYKDAIKNYSSAIKLDPKNSKAFNSRGVAYNNINIVSSAIDDYSQAIKFDNKNVKAYRNRANIYGRIQDYDKAIADATIAINIKPDYYKAFVTRGEAYFFKGKFDLAIRDYNDAIKLNPMDPILYGNRSVAHMLSGNYNKGIKDYKKALKQKLSSAMVHSNLCCAGYLTDHVDNFMYSCDEAVKISKNFWTLESRGIARALKSNKKGAINDLQKAVQWLKAKKLYDKHDGHMREKWISDLKAGNNPFDKATLKSLMPIDSN